MCGIAGIYSVNEKVDGRSLGSASHRMVQCMHHRGPDGQGAEQVCVRPAVIFSHTRLAIIDLSNAGHQPMCDSESENWITYNGEIYNYRELRTELRDRGCRFKSNSDTEVILKAYGQWGSECVKRFQGMFAFAL